MNTLQEYIHLILNESLPVVKTTDFLKVLNRLGYEIDRQNGSHMVFKPTRPGMPSIPSVKKDREVAVGTLRNIIRAAGLSDGDFNKLLRSI